MGLRPGPRQQAGREVTPLGDPGGETAKSRARHGSLKGVGGCPRAWKCGGKCNDGGGAVLLLGCCCRWCHTLYVVVEQGSRWCGAVLVNRWTVELVGEVCVVVFNWRQWRQLLK